MINVADYQCPDIDDAFTDIIATSIVTTILDERLAVHYERVTGHDLTTRRYYRQFAYWSDSLLNLYQKAESLAYYPIKGSNAIPMLSYGVPASLFIYSLLQKFP